jgi:hypothetical protein
MTFKEEKYRANETYKLIFENKNLSAQASKICQSLAIDPETLQPKRLQNFE